MTQAQDPSTGPQEPFLGGDPVETPSGPQDTAAPGAGAPLDAQTEPGTADEASPADVADGGNDLVAELATAQSAVVGLTDDLKRLQAEFLNYKRRVDRDRELVKENAVFSVLTGLMPVLDDVDRAREHEELSGGFRAVAEALERSVAAQGLVKFGERGDPFDPRLHEALMHSHSPDVTTTTCQDIVSAGYRIGERVVRPARVTVVDPEPEATE